MLVRFPLGYEMLELCYLPLVHVSRNCRNAVMKKKAPGLERELVGCWLMSSIWKARATYHPMQVAQVTE